MVFSHDIKDIYNHHIDELYAYAIHLGFDKNTVMDAIHDVFFRLCNNQSQLNSVTNIRAYLFGALKNTLLNTIRNNKEYLSIEDFPMPENHYFNIKVSIEDYLINSEEEEKIRQLINNMLNSLTPRQREIVYLRYIEEYDYEEITHKMGIDINSCHKLMHKAMSTLRNQFGIYSFLLINTSHQLFTAIFTSNNI
ncbi:MAG: RNA polymerase sigma factor [Bacteroidia bacterium]|nr:RNA polymerase sigma factor [Bacteroidia bacterium]